MFKYIFLLLLCARFLFAQNQVTVKVMNADEGKPLAGANVYFQTLRIGASANTDGLAQIKGIPDGRHTLIVSYVGFRTKKIPLHFPNPKYNHTLIVLLEPAPFSSEQIVVTSTRNNSVLGNTPVRIEVLGKEEVNEEIAIRPGNLSKFLGESASIITRYNSAISGAISFRLQGLPARYTQILKDGFPDFSGLASGFSPLQIPPLDLKQIEITRGVYSSLFGNGALAGTINLISRSPSSKPRLDLLVNRTDRQGSDIGFFYSARYRKTGLTFLASQNLQNAVDVNGDGFSDIPRFRQTTVNPRLFYHFGPNTSFMIGLTSFFGNRIGGDMHAIKNGTDSLHTYTETYATKRLGINLRFKKQLVDSGNLTLKASYQNFNQDAVFPHSYFSGQQKYAFAEASYFRPAGRHKWVGGLSLVHRSFKQQNTTFAPLYDNYNTTVGLFAQDDWRPLPAWTIHGGMRWDFRLHSRSFLLPEAAILFAPQEHLKLRLSGGYGYSVPSLYEVVPHNDYFTYRIDRAFRAKPERSRDIAFDATYRYAVRDFALSVNQAFYATRVDHAQFATGPAEQTSVLFSAARLTAKGAETHLVINLETLELFVDYNYADVRRWEHGQRRTLPFTPKNKINLTLTYEKEGNWRTGVEGFFTGEQCLPDGSKGRAYFVLGFMFEKKFDRLSLVFNVENLLDERQSKYESLIIGPAAHPNFKTPYMPVEGRVANLVAWFKF